MRHAVTVAMQAIFESEDAPAQQRGVALDLAIRAAEYMNRFAAMDTCNGMIKRVRDPELAFQVAAIILNHRDSFLSNIDPVECRAEIVKNAIHQIRRTENRS